MMSPAISTSTRGLTTSELGDELGIDRSPSSLVRIDHARLALVSRQLDLRTAAPASWDDPLFWNTDGTAEQRSQFFAVGNAVNFRFWRLVDGVVVPEQGEIDGRAYRGAMYMWRSLRRALDAGVPVLDAAFLANLTDADFDAVFTDEHGHNPLAVARDDRIANLRDLGRILLADWNGRFVELVRASRGSLVGFAHLSRRLRAFDDPVYKLTMVNAIMHAGSGVFAFRDEPLPAIDYHLLRQALRQGLLLPEALLRGKLTRCEPLTTPESQELRRVALAAFVDLSARSGVSGQILDNRYWANRVNCSDQPVCLNPATAARCPFLDACALAREFALPVEWTRYY